MIFNLVGWSEQLEKIESKLAEGVFVLRNLWHLQNTYATCLLEFHISYSIVLWGAEQNQFGKDFEMAKKPSGVFFNFVHSLTSCRKFSKTLHSKSSTFIYFGSNILNKIKRPS